MTNAEVLDLCGSLGIGTKSHSSGIVEAQADRARRKAVREGLTRDLQPEQPEAEKPAAGKKPATKKKAAKPAAGKKPAARKKPATKKKAVPVVEAEPAPEPVVEAEPAP
ncbi:MAG: translation initiation factor IF-2, partial [Actinobacteria bacterium]